MPLVSQTIPNFINGISQQTPTQRGLNQGTKQINMQSKIVEGLCKRCLLYTSPSPRDVEESRMPSSA